MKKYSNRSLAASLALILFFCTSALGAEPTGNWLKIKMDLDKVQNNMASVKCASNEVKCNGACFKKTDGERTLQPNCSYKCPDAKPYFDGTVCVIACAAGTTACKGTCMADTDVQGRGLQADCTYKCPSDKPWLGKGWSIGTTVDGAGTEMCRACPTGPDYAEYDTASEACKCKSGMTAKLWSPGCKCPENSRLNGATCDASGYKGHEAVPVARRDEIICKGFRQGVQLWLKNYVAYAVIPTIPAGQEVYYESNIPGMWFGLYKDNNNSWGQFIKMTTEDGGLYQLSTWNRGAGNTASDHEAQYRFATKSAICGWPQTSGGLRFYPSGSTIALKSSYQTTYAGITDIYNRMLNYLAAWD